jgi:hypothetical protein
VNVEKGEVIALFDGKLVASARTMDEALQKLFTAADLARFERITFFYGEEMQAAQVNKVADSVRAQFPLHEIEVHSGGQPHYNYIIAFE